jgi:hypothetical protein
MSIKILKIEEAKEVEKLCKKYGEVCEVLYGKAKVEYFCDNTGVTIEKGSECAVVLVLPSKSHHNYQHQKDIMKDYIDEPHS